MSDIELFLDRERISWEYNLTRQLCQPVRVTDQPLLQPQYPWEESFVTLYGSILKKPDGGLRMWYMAGARQMRGHQTLCCADSDDGFAWRRLMVGGAYADHERSNIVLGPRPNVHGPCVIENAHSDDPRQRYLLLYDAYSKNHPSEQGSPLASRSCYVATSPDGLAWTLCPGPAILGKSDTGQSVVWDPVRRRYIAYLRGTRGPHKPWAEAYGESNRVRYVRIATSSDFINWSDPIEAFRCDERDGDPDHQAHQLSVTRVGTQYVGLLSIFQVDRLHEIPHAQVLMEEGGIDTQLVCSRDGIHWTRVCDRETFFPMGAPGRWDSKWLVTASQIVFHDNRMLFYYAATDVDRGAQPAYQQHPDPPPKGRLRIGVATLPRGRFQMLRPRRLNQPGVLETRPLYLGEGDLTVNADASCGELRVELCGFDGKVIEGFSRSDCEPLRADALRHRMRWRGGGLSEAVAQRHVAQRAIRLRFYLHQASLYAMAVPLDREAPDGR